jgi:ubiquinone/menaquinone biosynthesis C-methylase UbiE
MSNFPKGTTVSGADSKIEATHSSGRFPETPDIETSSDDYASRFSGPIGEWLLTIQERATLNMLKPYPGATILDVGGGHGQLTPALIHHGYQVTVLGSDESCQERILSFLEKDLCQFQVGNVLDLPYPDNTFDVVVSYRFLAHITQWQTFLSELNRVAKKAIIVDYPTTRSFNSIAPLLFKLKKNIEQNTRPYISYEERQIFDFLKSIESQPKERYAEFFWPMVLHRMMGSPGISSILERIVRLIGATSLLGSPVILKSCKKT